MSDQISTSTQHQTSISTIEHRCSICGASIPPKASGDYTSNYGLMEDHSIVCLQCAANMDRGRLQRGEDVTLYCQKTSTGNWVLMNWHGAIFVEVFQRVRSSKHIVFGKTRTQRTDYYFKYGDRLWHGTNIGDNDLVHCKAQKTKAPARRAHYIALGGLRGYMPNFCEVFETKTSAAQYIADIHELSDRAMLRLRRDMSIDLDLHEHGNEYAEIVECWCTSPADHGDGPLFDDI